MIKGCGDKTLVIGHLLHQMWFSIQEAIESIENSEPQGTPVYNKFFAGVDPIKIKDILTNVATGPNVFIHDQLHQPQISCANPDLPELASAWAYCQQTDPAIAAMWMPYTPWIYLCPFVFTEPKFPTEQNCVGVHTPFGYSSGQLLASTQFSNLLHELVHLYLGPESLRPEVYTLWDVINLTAEESAINPASYVFYIASRSLGFSLVFGVSQ